MSWVPSSSPQPDLILELISISIHQTSVYAEVGVFRTRPSPRDEQRQALAEQEEDAE